MVNNLRWILSAVAIVVAMVLPDVSYAQLDAAAMARAQRNGENTNIYGSTIPGMEGTGMEGEEGMEDADTTATKKKRERKPLESYYFTDTVRALPNWKWNVDRYYNRVNIMPLDTTLSDWRIDYVFYRKGVGDMALGGLGQSSQPINWFDTLPLASLLVILATQVGIVGTYVSIYLRPRVILQLVTDIHCREVS